MPRKVINYAGVKLMASTPGDMADKGSKLTATPRIIDLGDRVIKYCAIASKRFEASRE